MGAVAPRFAKSPDEADAASLVLQAAMIQFGFYPGERRKVTGVTSFENEKMQAMQAITGKPVRPDFNAPPARPAPPSVTFSAPLTSLKGLFQK